VKAEFDTFDLLSGSAGFSTAGGRELRRPTMKRSPPTLCWS
jgi:hypothetical protein